MAAAATTAGKDPVYHHIWQDREIRFDSSTEALKIRRGERVIDTINAVEDTKGNNGDRGALSITNLRVIWCSHKNPSTNLSTLTTIFLLLLLSLHCLLRFFF